MSDTFNVKANKRVFPWEIFGLLMDADPNPSWDRVCKATRDLWRKKPRMPINIAAMAIAKYRGISDLFSMFACNKCKNVGSQHVIDGNLNIVCPLQQQSSHIVGWVPCEFDHADASADLKLAWSKFASDREALESTIPWQSVSLTVEFHSGRTCVVTATTTNYWFDVDDFEVAFFPSGNTHQHVFAQFVYELLSPKTNILDCTVKHGDQVLLVASSSDDVVQFFTDAAKWQVEPVPLSRLNVTKSVPMDDEDELIYIENFKLRGEPERTGCWGLARKGLLIWLIKASHITDFLHLYFEEPLASVIIQGNGVSGELQIRNHGITLMNWPITGSVTTPAERLRCIVREVIKYLADFIGAMDDVSIEVSCEKSPVSLLVYIGRLGGSVSDVCWRNENGTADAEVAADVSMDELIDRAFEGDSADVAWHNLSNNWDVTMSVL